MPVGKCENCQGLFPLETLFGDGPVSCPTCGKKLLLDIFPSILSSFRKGEKAETIMESAHSSCFHHPDKAAVVICEECGIYLCSLCDLEVEGRHLCSNCLKKSKEKLKSLKADSVLYDDIVLSVAVISTLIFYFAVVTAPFVLIYSIMKWNKVNVPYRRRSKLRFSIAIILSSLQIIAIAAIIIYLIFEW